MHNNIMMQVRHLKKYFSVKQGTLKAVDDVSFDIFEGETLGLVGESGCGKTTIGKTLIRLYEPTSGSIFFQGKDISHMKEKELKPLRKDMQIIFQDPYASLNPRMSVSEIISEPLEIHFHYSKQEKEKKIAELLDLVGLSNTFKNRYPHEFSGGQRQRIGIARALASNPKLIICDEPISALDVSIQAQIVNLLEDLQKEKGLAYLFIAHDLSMVRHISNRIGVMYLGHMVEMCDSKEIYKDPMHPYTKALFSAEPIADPKLSENITRILIEGDIPTPINPPKACAFHTRCPHVFSTCKTQIPSLRELKPNHFVACHLYDGEHA